MTHVLANVGSKQVILTMQAINRAIFSKEDIPDNQYSTNAFNFSDFEILKREYGVIAQIYEEKRAALPSVLTNPQELSQKLAELQNIEIKTLSELSALLFDAHKIIKILSMMNLHHLLANEQAERKDSLTLNWLEKNLRPQSDLPMSPEGKHLPPGPRKEIESKMIEKYRESQQLNGGGLNHAKRVEFVVKTTLSELNLDRKSIDIAKKLIRASIVFFPKSYVNGKLQSAYISRFQF